MVDAVKTTPVQVKIVMTSSDDSSEDGEHFYDAASEIHSDNDDNVVGTGSSAPSRKDSGVEVDGQEVDFEIPDAQLSAQIIEQVEFYFSDAHILKDAFLLKHARRNRDGYISLKLITSFKKVKHVSKDWRVVAYACRQSSKLEVNETGTKVRRIAPLPDTDETSPSRTIVAIGIPAEKATIELVAEMFASAGSIALIRILRPGSAVPPDVRQCANRNPEILTSICAVVEFEMAESARAALREFLDAEARPVIRLVELAARRSNKNTPNSSRPVTPATSSPSSPPSTPPSSPPDSEPNRRKRRGPAKNKAVQNVSALENGTWSSSDAEDKSPFNRRKDFYIKPISQTSTPNQSPQQRRHVTLANGANGTNGNNRNSPRKSLTSSPEMRCRQKSSSYSEPSSPGSHSPWVQRRMAAVTSTPDSNGKSGPANLADNRLSVPGNIVRLPLGPDGTRGFHIHNKPRSASAPEVPRMTMVTAF